MAAFFIGVDLGTTAVKAALFDSDFNLLRLETREVDLSYPGPGMVEQSPECWFEVPCELINRLCAGIKPDSIKAIGTSSQGISFIPVDEFYKPLSGCGGISWLDTRAEAELNRALDIISEDDFFAVTGKHPSAQYTMPKLLWFKNHCPELFDHAAKLLMPLDYFTARLCGRAVTDPTMAGGTMLYDLDRGEWSDRLCSSLGIPANKLAEVKPTGTAAGYLCKEACTLTGLSSATLVAVGAQDQKIAAYGAGIEPGTVTLSMGTAGAIEVLSDRKSDVLPTFKFELAGGGFYVLEGCINTFGAAIKWARDNVFCGLSYREMDALAQTAPRGCGGVQFYPHLSGVSTPHYGESVIAGWSGMTLSTDRAQLIRSVYEGLAREVKANLTAANRAGAEIKRLRLFGGGAKSVVLRQIIADETGFETEEFAVSEAAALGAAKAAALCAKQQHE
jgi:Sugar (pentulose and hexulose) kinases